MMRQPQSRWLLSFTDLTLVLLAFFVMLQAQRQNPDKVVRGIAAAFAPAQDRPVRLDARKAFMPGEAILRPEAAAAVATVARNWGPAGRVHVVSSGDAGAGARFDRWEFAAARTAAIARALHAAGIPAETIDIDLEPAPGGRQTIEIAHVPR